MRSYENTGGGGTPTLPRLPRAYLAKGCKNSETATLTTFRINTCKSVSKQRTLTPLRINTYKKPGEGGYLSFPRLQRPASSIRSPEPSAPRGASIPCGLSGLRILPVTTGVYESVWQLCCLGEFLVISMIHLHSSEVVARGGFDFLCARSFQWGLSRHMRVRFNSVAASANSAATFLNPRIRNLRIPRCSFKIPMTGSASAFRRRYNARPVIEANLLRMRRRAA